jgi:hypothetical protein
VIVTAAVVSAEVGAADLLVVVVAHPVKIKPKMTPAIAVLRRVLRCRSDGCLDVVLIVTPCVAASDGERDDKSSSLSQDLSR